MRDSVFDDPGDEKSWHVSQRSESLARFYEGREPSWYASAIAPLAGADRVLDLGCGPGLALRALREQGSSTVLGVERWPAFVAGSTPEAPIVTHDLTLPMPFLESGSFEGVLSHYVLDYLSPICVRQVLREAHRVLAPGGRLVAYLAAMGLGGGDESRTICYSPEVVRALLEEAGFDELEVEASPNGRNTVARARRPAHGSSVVGEEVEPWAAIDGDTQLSASFRGAGGGLKLELSAVAGEATFSLELPAPEAGDALPASVCARTLRRGAGGTELQLCAWRGSAPILSESVRVDFPATEMRVVAPQGEVGHVSVWRPGELSLEPPGNAYARLAELADGGDLNEVERGAEGRQVAVESAGDSGGDGWDRLGPGRNRFLIRRASALDLSRLEGGWLAGRVHGVAVDAAELEGDRLRELLRWSGCRQSLLYLGAADWREILAVASRRRDEMTGPAVLVDPALAWDGAPRALPTEVAAFAQETCGFFVLLGAASRDLSSSADLARLRRRLLHGGPTVERAEPGSDENETLRYLTERTLLLRLRQASGLSPAEVGRRRWPA